MTGVPDAPQAPAKLCAQCGNDAIEGVLCPDCANRHRLRVERDQAVDKLAQAEYELGELRKQFPCDEGCRDYPEETCSLHGRSPRDLWERWEEQLKRAEHAEAEVNNCPHDYHVVMDDLELCITRAEKAEAQVAAVRELIALCNDAQHGYAVPVDYLLAELDGATPGGDET